MGSKRKFFEVSPFFTDSSSTFEASRTFGSHVFQIWKRFGVVGYETLINWSLGHTELQDGFARLIDLTFIRILNLRGCNNSLDTFSSGS